MSYQSGWHWLSWEFQLSSSQTLEAVEPRRLPVVFRGQDASVEEDENDDEPVERLRLDRLTRSLAYPTIQLRQASPNNHHATHAAWHTGRVTDTSAVTFLRKAIEGRRCDVVGRTWCLRLAGITPWTARKYLTPSEQLNNYELPTLFLTIQFSRAPKWHKITQYVIDTSSLWVPAVRKIALISTEWLPGRQ